MKYRASHLLLLAVGVSLAFATAAAARGDSISAALSHSDRPEVDRPDDAKRKPGQVLEFFGIEPGMDVLDLLAGGGYYTEIVSRAVGPEGSVIFHNNQPYREFLGEAIDNRTVNNRLPNVKALTAEVNHLKLEAGQLDAILFVLGFHDIYYEDDSWPAIDGEKLLEKLYDGLRPGGILGIVDHSAKAGSDPVDSGSTLHRIDEAFAKQQIEAAGFTLEASSDILRNAGDDRSIQVFDESIRRQTDRFVLLFRKPAV